MTPIEAAYVMKSAVIAAGPQLGRVADQFAVATPRGPLIPDAQYPAFQEAFLTALAYSSPSPAQSRRVAEAFGILATDPVEGAQLWSALAYLVAPFSASFKRAKALRDVAPGARA